MIAVGILISIMTVMTALLVACEFALVRLRYSPLEMNAEEELRKDRLTRFLVEDPDRTARALRFGKTLTTLAVGAGLLLLNVQAGWDRLESGYAWVAPTILLIAGGGVFYVLAELFPRAVAIHSPLSTLRAVQLPVNAFLLLVYPLLRFIRMFKTRLYDLLKLNLDNDLNPLDVEVQLRAMGEEAVVLSPAVRKIIDRAIQLPDLVASDILLPRNQVRWINLFDPPAESLQMARQTGHTRFPLCEGDLDHCLGLIHIKDIFRSGRADAAVELRKLCRPIARVGQEEKLVDCLQRLISQKTHMARVEDDFGGTIGVITLEAIIEELLGDIQDEFDVEHEFIVKISDQLYEVDGLTALHDLEEVIGRPLERDDVSTVGGLVTAELGCIPERGAQLTYNHLQFTVEQVDERRVVSLRVQCLQPNPEPDITLDQEA